MKDEPLHLLAAARSSSSFAGASCTAAENTRNASVGMASSNHASSLVAGSDHPVADSVAPAPAGTSFAAAAASAVVVVAVAVAAVHPHDRVEISSVAARAASDISYSAEPAASSAVVPALPAFAGSRQLWLLQLLQRPRRRCSRKRADQVRLSSWGHFAHAVASGIAE